MAPTSEEQKEDERAQRDLVSYAKTLTADIYLLLDLPSPFTSSDPAVIPPTDAELGKAWRRAALKYHPDKNRGDEEAAADRLDEARRAWEVLKDPEARAAYEGKRRAETERRQREQALEGRRRGLAEALRQREEAASTPGGTKRGYGDFSGSTGATPAGEKEAKLRRLEEEGRRRRMEFQEAARKRREETTQSTAKTEEINMDDRPASGGFTETTKKEATQVPELDRTIKVRWPRGSPLGNAMTSDTLRRLFTRFGAVESAAMLKDKKTRPSMGSPLFSPSMENETQKRSKRQVMASAVVMFESIVAAHAAVHDALLMSTKLSDHEKAAEPEWALLDFVGWAGGAAPDLGFDTLRRSPSMNADSMKSSEDPFIDAESARHQSSSTTTFTAPRPFPGMSTSTANSSTPAKTGFTPGGKGPTFSFGTKSQAAANGSPKAAGTPSNYEATMMRLKEAERKKLEAQIREDDARAQAQEQPLV